MKTAVITGGSGAIGEALVKEFAKDYRVIFTYNTGKEKADEIADKYCAEAFCCDVTDYERIEELKRLTNSCDLLINNAGISQIQLFTDITPQEWRNMIDVNLNGAFNMTHVLLPMMIKQKHGNIINISSVWGVHGASCEVHYSAAKAGLIGFTKALAKEVGISGVRVNAIAPGVIESNMNGHLTEEELETLKDGTPLVKIGTPYDVAQAARYLAEAEFVTGQILGVDGGFY
mgnify:CR=1 FL=1